MRAPGRTVRARTLAALVASAALAALAGCSARASLDPPTMPLSRTREESFRSSVPVLSPRAEWTAPSVERFTLSNGVPVYFVARPGARIVSIGYVNRRAGSFDPRVTAGLPVLTAAMLRSGTLAHPGRAHRSARHALGVELEVTAWRNGLEMWVHTLAAHAAPAVDLLAEAVIEPELSQAALDQARSAQLVARAQQGESLANIAFELGVREVFGDGAAESIPELGYLSRLRGFTRDDVLAYHRSRYTPPNSALAVSGDISLEALRAMLERSFGDWRVADAVAIDRPPRSRSVSLGRRPWLLVDAGAEQSLATFALVWRMPTLLEPEFYTAIVAFALYGSMSSSRLNAVFREREGSTYTAEADYMGGVHWGLGYARINVDRARVADSVVRALAEADRLRTRPPRRALVESAQQHLRGLLLERFEGSEGTARVLATLAEFELGPDSWDQHLRGIDAVTPEAVRAFADRFMRPEQATVVVVADASVVAPELRARSELGAVIMPFSP
jgi:predicted Zn-dependent peptidase